MKQDAITLKRIDLLHPILREEVKTMYDEICESLTGRAVCRFSHTLRTDKEQDELYAQGRTKPGKKVTNAKGGQSYHNYGLAFDIVLIIDNKEASWDTLKDFDGDKTADWQEVVKIAKKYGWEWGGDWPKFKDAPHFQKTFGKKVSELKVLRKGNLYPVL
jgi:peptidoglycan L-alanyl-D-glutamate endopeptidase CwlK